MLKRALNYVLGREKGLVMEYEQWSKAQLIQRIQELEKESAIKSSEPISHKRPLDEEDKKSHENANDEQVKNKKAKTFDMSNYNQRYIAVKFAYTGWNYNGLALQFEPTPLPTVEEEILKALTTAKLIASADPKEVNFSRCGRTDKGVSALSQVIALNVRSRLSPEEQKDPDMDSKEIPYATALNSLLPTDIRITSICLRPPPDFDARFSCSYRHYKYIFHKSDLDLDLMKEAARLYVGRHDFRNFCKIDGSKNITNYVRDIISADIVPFERDYYVFDLKGTAFLWHQVRCMMAILFLVGQKLESPNVVNELFDVEKNNGKPIYDMADDIPLILYDCVFPEMEWVPGIETARHPKILRDNQLVRGLLNEIQIKSMVTSMVAERSLHDETDIKQSPGQGVINIGDGRGRNFKKYTKLMNRPVLDSFEKVNAKHKEKKKRKLANEQKQQ